jgi:biopolymer transport protein ExbD
MFLLVFFVVLSVNMIAGTGVEMNIPGSKTSKDIEEATITVGVKKDNQFIVDGETISGDVLTTKLLSLKENRKVAVIIAGDKDVQLETLINVMDSIRGAGINSVGIAAIATEQ